MNAMGIITLAPLALFGIFAIINVVIGLCTGFKKSIARLAAIVAAAIIAFIVTLIVCSPTSNLMTTVSGFINEIVAGSAVEEIFAVEALGISISYYISMLVSPFFFTVVFIALSIILSIVAAIVIRLIFRDKKPGPLLNRLGGSLIGLVCAILITSFILTPIVGTISLITPALELDEVKESFAEGEELTESGVIKVFAVTTSPVYNALTSRRFAGQRVQLKNEIHAIVTIVDSLGALSSVDMTEYGEEQIEALDTLLVAFDSSPLLKNTVAEIIAEAANKWIDGEEFAGMPKPTAEDMIAPFVDAILDILSTSTMDTIEKDLRTVKDIFAIMIRSDVFKNSGDSTALLDKLNGNGVISAIFDVIGQNERMAPISDEITNFSIRVIAEAVGMPEDKDERYDLLMTQIADALATSFDKPYQGRINAVKDGTKSAFDVYGIEVTGDTLDQIVTGLLADLGGRRNVTAADVKEFFTMYAIAGKKTAAVNASGYDMLATNTPTIKVAPDGTITVNGVELRNYHGSDYKNSAAYTMGSTGVDLEGAASLYSAEAMESTVITIEDLMSGIKKYGDCVDIAAETKKVSNIFTRALSIFDEIDFDDVDATVLMAKLGEFLDMMRDSQVLGEKTTSNMLLAILQSRHIIKPLGISVSESTNFANKINEMVESGKFDYLHATGVISDTIAMMEAAGSFANKTKEEKLEDAKKLLENISPESAEMLSSLVTPSLVENYGVPTNKSDTVSSTVTSLLDNMANYKGKSEEDVKKESEAVSTLLDFTVTASGSKGPLFNDGTGSEGSLNTTADEFVELVVTSEVVYTTIDNTVYRDGNTDNPFGARLSDQDTVEVTNAIENYYDNNGGGDELATKLEAVAIMLNVDVALGE